ncbi:hypothetical protein B0A55_13102 [Friedmanniomyces simplex]|uniref:Uncharacterized protein n=1 Tax=Friedmanniomyces simplex TaxID=329884 RepID=A0A4U0WG21_9PEZI|nr:hypothetical protein B0A55_13102 [Friedmanniomyces simplex]
MAQLVRTWRGVNEPPNGRLGEMEALHYAYRFAFGIRAVTHLAIVILLATRKLFPNLFSPLALDFLGFRDVFLPPLFTTRTNTKDMATGIHNFFQYDQYVGSTAATA